MFSDQAVFSEMRQAAELLQQFSGFFVSTALRFQLAMRHTCFCPVALFDLHGVFFNLGTLGCSQHLGVASLASIVSGDGCSIFRVQIDFQFPV